MSDETHDQWGEPYRNANAFPVAPVAGSDCLNRPPRSREAAALDVARETLRTIDQMGTAGHLPRRALAKISTILNEAQS